MWLYQMFSARLWAKNTKDNIKPKPNNNIVLFSDWYSFVSNGSKNRISVDKKSPRIKAIINLLFKVDGNGICLLMNFNGVGLKGEFSF